MGNIGRIFTKDAWKGGKSIGQNLLDPGAFFTKFEESTNAPKKPPTIDEEAAAEREKERRRVSGGASTSFSGRKADALSASIGKRMLGGSL